MPAEKALAIVLRTIDFSETSRVVTLWTREFGKVRALAKGGRRLRSAFENGLDLLGVCSISLLRKSSGGLDLLTEAQVVRRFPRLRADLTALYAAYYIAELLADWSGDYDPHPIVFDEALATLQALGDPDHPNGPRLARFEFVLLRELGYGPSLDGCAVCGETLDRADAFSPAAGGVLCTVCLPGQSDRRPITAACWRALRDLDRAGDAWRGLVCPEARAEVRQVLNHYVTYLLGRRPRLLPYLGS